MTSTCNLYVHTDVFFVATFFRVFYPLVSSKVARPCRYILYGYTFQHMLLRILWEHLSLCAKPFHVSITYCI